MYEWEGTRQDWGGGPGKEEGTSFQLSLGFGGEGVWIATGGQGGARGSGGGVARVRGCVGRFEPGVWVCGDRGVLCSGLRKVRPGSTEVRSMVAGSLVRRCEWMKLDLQVAMQHAAGCGLKLKWKKGRKTGGSGTITE